jgi:hypothetical protein
MVVDGGQRLTANPCYRYPAERKEKNTISDKTKRPRTMIIRQGIAPWRGIMDVGVEGVDFFLILAEPITRAPATS